MDHSPPLTRYLGNDPRWTASTIRDLLVHARKPGVISLAGGLPAAEVLPVERFARAVDLVLDARGSHALQYGLSSGEPELRTAIGDLECCQPDNLLITAGSQQALDLVTRVVTHPGDTVFVEDPGYLGAIQILRSHGLRLIGIPVDANGLDVDRLADQLRSGARPRFVYVNPTHQNPTGANLALDRAQRLVELAERFGFLIVVDDPYVEIHLDGDASQGVLAATESPMIARLGSISKTLSPGLRIGWLQAEAALIDRVVLAKQSADLHTSTVNQLVVAEILGDKAWWSCHLGAVRTRYCERRLALLDAVSNHLPDAKIQPQRGGFFLWATLSSLETRKTDSASLLPDALRAGVAFVPGSAFSIDRAVPSSFRLSYSSGDPDDFPLAVQRLAAIVGPINEP